MCRASHCRPSVAIYAMLLAMMTVSVGCNSTSNSSDAKSSTTTTPAERKPFCLTTEFFPIQHEDRLFRVPLVRELGRQAVLIAARDGLGLPTRDETLGESFPKSMDDRLGPFGLKVRAYHAGNGTLSLTSVPTDKAAGQAPIEVANYPFHFQGDTYNLYTSLAITLGPASRTYLVELLQEAGCTGQEVKNDPGGAFPEDVESQLAEMDFTVQYDAVRRIHDVIARVGESPARLGGLVRGYANLAMLTRHHWSSTSAVFAARALLYAERLRSISDDPRLALQHRAYARALIGLHGIALQDLARLPGEPPPADDAEKALPWIKVIEPFCRFEDETVLELAKEPGLAQLAPQLAFEIKVSYGDARWTSDIGRSTAKVAPESYGVYAAMADGAPMLVQREAVRLSAELFGRRLPRSVKRIAGLPKPATELVTNITRPEQKPLSRMIQGNTPSSAYSPLPMQLVGAMRNAHVDPRQAGEPSWEVLAKIIADEQFIQVANLLEVSLNAVESSKQDLVESINPLVAGHPYEAYILCFAVDGQRQPDELARLLGRISVEDPRGRMKPLFDTYPNAMDANGRTFAELSTEALWQRDYHLPALIESLNNVHASWWLSPIVGDFQRLIVDLQYISPHAPNLLRMEISTTVDPRADQLADWESRASSNPIALNQIAKLYAENGDLEAAIRCYEQSYELSPNHEVTLNLAAAYRDNGQPDKWRPTIDRYLNVEDNGLGHSVLARHIAQDHIERREWAEAEPHALVAARTWSTMGLITASRVYEGMGRWGESEKWIRESTVNYPTYNGMQWYLWCRRTGRGDRQQAKIHADQFLKFSAAAHWESSVHYPFLNDMFNERYDHALARIERTAACDADLTWQIQAELLAKQLDRDEAYDLARGKVEFLLDKQPKNIRPHVEGLVAILHAGREAPLTEQQLGGADKLLDELPYKVRCDFAHYLGESLLLQGEEKLAETYWRKALESGQFDNRNVTLAGWRLAERHGTSSPGEVKPAKVEADQQAAVGNP